MQNPVQTSIGNHSAARIAAIRDRMARAGLSGFLVPRVNAHRGEWVPQCDDRLNWLTGFTGSMGLCVVATEHAALFVDGRYTVQAKQQADGTIFEILEFNQAGITSWITNTVENDCQIGFDPWLHTKFEIERQQKGLSSAAITLRRTENPIDAIWSDRPDPPRPEVCGYPDSHAGESSTSKRQRMAEQIRLAGADAAVLTLPDSIAWLLNIRSSDLPNSPVALAFAVLTTEGKVTLYLDLPRKFSTDAKTGPDIRPKADFIRGLAETGNTVLVDPKTAPLLVLDRLQELGRSVIEGADPCILAKAIKNQTEIASTKVAHRRDGAALAEFLAWLDSRDPSEKVTEMDIVEAVDGFRRKTGYLRSPSFSTIAASGPNAAIVHYSVSPASNRTLSQGELLLVDSGGQYLDGTTDVTRTIAIGDPSREFQTCFTRVLKGLIAVARARWPRGRAGHHLDAIARYHLWLAGQDFDHGTGHGVGHYMNVHEGPQAIGPNSGSEILPGMILSIEPGYYREEEFGIRIENLAVVAQVPPADVDNNRSMLEFHNLTWAPIDRRLILVDMLTIEERQWIDQYHRRVLDEIKDCCSETTAVWLQKVCAQLV
ncbi:MAG: aminopeptidase P family protein [Rhodobacteraceae bacterium]|nr:aminopeptidase P family protein [Paracoccaceae bacterium]